MFVLLLVFLNIRFVSDGAFATLKQDAAILRLTRDFYGKGDSSQLYCRELVALERDDGPGTSLLLITEVRRLLR